MAIIPMEISPFSPVLTITNPQDGSQVPMSKTVSGTYQNIPSDLKIWVIIKWENLYFPTKNAADNDSKGNWWMDCTIGVKDDPGKTYNISVALVNSAAENYFRQWDLSFLDNKTHFDMTDENFPTGATVYHSIVVNRFATINEPSITPTVTPAPISTPTLTPISITPTSTQTTSITIDHLENGTLLDMQQEVSGTYNNIPVNSKIWVVIKYEYFYYPQVKEALLNNGKWSYTATIGNPPDGGKTFTILVVLANEDAQTSFKNWMTTFNNATSTDTEKQMLQLPSGVIVYTSVEGIRKNFIPIDTPTPSSTDGKIEFSTIGVIIGVISFVIPVCAFITSNIIKKKMYSNRIFEEESETINELKSAGQNQELKSSIKTKRIDALHHLKNHEIQVCKLLTNGDRKVLCDMITDAVSRIEKIP
jgi:hypothetical protein